MSIRKILLLTLCYASLTGVAKEINPLTKAMLDGYAMLLEQNPDDYLTLYERSSQYYRLDDYDKALSDIKKAISCTPGKEKDQLVSEYSLLADIYTQLGQYAEALMAVDQGLILSPDSYPLLYMRGNTCLHLNQTEAAGKAFAAMQRLNPRSPEAVFGLAHVSALEGNKEQAMQYLVDAEKLDPSNYLTFCRTGDVHRILGMHQNAAADYLSAFSLTGNSDRPLRSLIDLAKENYEAVDQAIDYALTHTANVVPLYFIQGSAARECGHYDDAYAAFRQLMDNVPEADAQGLYTGMADICLHRGNLEEADAYASKAMAAGPDFHLNIVKAEIEQARGNYPSAAMYAEAALRMDRACAEALRLAALAAYRSGEPDKALAYLNEAVMNDASDMDALLFRGYLNGDVLGNKTAALNDFTRVASQEAKTDAAIARKAIAQLKAGMSLDASATIAPVNVAAGNHADAAYLMALYNLAADNEAEGDRMLKRAVELGLEDQYLLRYNEYPLLTVKKLIK